MLTSRKTLWVVALLVVAFAPLGLAQDENDEKTKKEEHFFANIGGGGARALQMVVSRWSTESERARLLGILSEEGQEPTMKALEKLEKTGWVRIQGGRYPSTALRYAYESKTKEGKRHIVLLTNRPVSLAEARSQGRSEDYNLTMIELMIDDNGKGSGALAAGAEVEIDEETNRLKITAFQTTPTKLVNVYTK